MDLTKLPKELFYKDKESIYDFDIEDNLSVDGILYNNLTSQPIIPPQGWDRERMLLKMFNDAYFLVNMLIIDKSFNLHTHSWIEEYNKKWNNNNVVLCIFYMTSYYINNTSDIPLYAQNNISFLIDDLKKLDSSKSIGINSSIGSLPNSNNKLLLKHFKYGNIQINLNRYTTFYGNVDWETALNHYSVSDVIKFVAMVGKNVNEQLCVLYDIRGDLNRKDGKYNYELTHLLDILVDNLVKDGILLSKKKLWEEYDRQQKEEEECNIASLEQDYVDYANRYFAKQRIEYEEIIQKQKNEIEQLKNENDQLKQIEERIVEEAFNTKTNLPCFTSRQIGILLTAVGRITEKNNPPGKTTIGDIVEKISGYKSTSATTNMKGIISHKDTEFVASVLENKFPNLAAEIRHL